MSWFLQLPEVEDEHKEEEAAMEEMYSRGDDREEKNAKMNNYIIMPVNHWTDLLVHCVWFRSPVKIVLLNFWKAFLGRLSLFYTKNRTAAK